MNKARISDKIGEKKKKKETFGWKKKQRTQTKG